MPAPWRRRDRFLQLLAAVLLSGLTAGVFSKDVARPRAVKVGDRVHDFELRDLRGKVHRLTDYRGRKAIVIAFNGVGCPIAELYAPRLQKISAGYRERGVQVLGINANRQDEVRELRAFSSRFGIRFPVLKDHGNVIADLLGAERTSEVLLLDAELVLRYRGRLDDQYTITDRSVGLRKERPEVRYLEDALEAILDGREVRTKVTEAPGCIIGRQREVTDSSSATYHGHVERIIQEKCRSCHREGQIAPFALDTYEDAAGWAGMIREVVETRRMPPWHADPRYGSFSNDRSLTGAERRTVIAWVDNGAPRGDPALRPAPVEFASDWQIGEPDVVFEMPESFRVPAQGTIEYQYFSVPTGFTEDRWVQAMEVVPGRREVVHHILVFARDPAQPKKWRRETAGGVRGYFAAMVPGQRPVIFPKGMAKKVPAGATLIFQVHYTANGVVAEDRSKIGLVFAREPVEHEVRTRSVAAVDLRIPPGDGTHEVTARQGFARDTYLLSFLPHMHLRGSAFRYRVHYPAGVTVSKPPWKGHFSRRVVERLRFDARKSRLVWLGELPQDAFEELVEFYDSAADRKALEALRKKARSEILLDVPAYDFGWQNTYRLAEPLRVPAGSLLEGRAIYDNSPSNPALTRDMWTKVVRWGNQTWDEMMIGYFDGFTAED